MKCECGKEKEVIGGCSAHPNNWYCPACDIDKSKRKSTVTFSEDHVIKPHGMPQHK